MAFVPNRDHEIYSSVYHGGMPTSHWHGDELRNGVKEPHIEVGDIVVITVVIRDYDFETKGGGIVYVVSHGCVGWIPLSWMCRESRYNIVKEWLEVPV